MNVETIKRVALAIGAGVLALSQRVSRWWLRTFRGYGNRGKLAFGCGSLVAACFVVSLCSTSLGILPAATQAEEGEISVPIEMEATASHVPPTNTIRPTNTSAPTVTDTIAPTNTSVPTNTPQPTNTPRPTNTATVPPTNTLPPPTNTLPPPTEPPPLATIPLPTNTLAPPSVPAGPCSCSGPDLDCSSDFDSRASAQACHDYCVTTVGYDYHGLDGNDNDGLACESLP